MINRLINKKYIKKHHLVFIQVIGLLLFCLSLFFYYQYKNLITENSSFVIFRLLRSVVCFSYLLIMLFFHRNSNNKLILLFLFFYGSSSFLTVWYENNILAILAMAFNALSFLLLIIAIVPKIKKINIDFFVILCTFIMILLFGFLGYQFLVMFKEMTLSTLHFSLIVLSSFGIALALYAAILYNHKYSSKNSVVFTSFVFLLLFAEVFRGIAYYNIAYGDFSAHIARALLIISLSFLTHYSFLSKTEEERLNSHLL